MGGTRQVWRKEGGGGCNRGSGEERFFLWDYFVIDEEGSFAFHIIGSIPAERGEVCLRWCSVFWV